MSERVREGVIERGGRVIEGVWGGGRVRESERVGGGG